MSYKVLFSPLSIRNVTVKNRIFFSAHATMLASGSPNDALIAYHEARAKGGAGLIVVEVASVHESNRYSDEILKAETDDCIPGYRRLAERVHQHDCRVFGQLYHSGREILHSGDGSAALAFAPSSVPNHRARVMPRAMPKSLVHEVIAAYGDAALRLQRAGLDGVEFLASQGQLPAQFLNPHVNHRTDEYGGNFDNRLRFVKEVIADIRSKVGDFVVGLRISATEQDTTGIDESLAGDICQALDVTDGVDYFSLVTGTSASLGGSVHIAPPMAFEAAYVAPQAARIKSRVSKPVMIAGRFNQPKLAEQALSAGDADMCAMTRALICDPELPNKTKSGRAEDVRACIACNQACIGHLHMGFPVSCIQHPETGRELLYGDLSKAAQSRHVMVVGGGPGGMKTAVVAAERGHHVTLYERSAHLGGQVALAQLLPGRAEFGGLVSNFSRELELSGVEVIRKTTVDRELIELQRPDVVVLATGATPYRPAFEGRDEAHVVDAWQVIKGEVNIGTSVVIADWRCDWVGLGLAEKFARDGCRVRLCVNGNFAGETIPQYVRDTWLGTLHELQVEIVPMVRLFGADSDSAYFEHATSTQPVVCDEMDTLVLALGHTPNISLEESLTDYTGDVVAVGDCLAPRTVEEAVLEGLKEAIAI